MAMRPCPTLLCASMVALRGAACADIRAPVENCAILAHAATTGAAGAESSRHILIDTYTLDGTIIAPNTGSMHAWHPIAGVAVDLVRVDVERHMLLLRAYSTTETEGRYVVNDPAATPSGLLGVIGEPTASSGYPYPSVLALFGTTAGNDVPAGRGVRECAELAVTACVVRWQRD
jgi:hypothetical protein